MGSRSAARFGYRDGLVHMVGEYKNDEGHNTSPLRDSSVEPNCENIVVSA